MRIQCGWLNESGQCVNSGWRLLRMNRNKLKHSSSKWIEYFICRFWIVCYFESNVYSTASSDSRYISRSLTNWTNEWLINYLLFRKCNIWLESGQWAWTLSYNSHYRPVWVSFGSFKIFVICLLQCRLRASAKSGYVHRLSSERARLCSYHRRHLSLLWISFALKVIGCESIEMDVDTSTPMIMISNFIPMLQCAIILPVVVACRWPSTFLIMTRSRCCCSRSLCGHCMIRLFIHIAYSSRVTVKWRYCCV